MNKKILFFYIFILLFSLCFIFCFSGNCFASTPKLISKLDGAFKNIEDWIIKLATPAAAVAVGTGVFMKKFSFGDEERIRISKKVIRGSIVSYCLLLTLDLILAAINSIIN